MQKQKTKKPQSPSPEYPRFACLSASTMHILAMLFMVCDHLWGTVVPGNDWLTMIGRLAFPIYAFMIVEGWKHTRSRKHYALRLLICALASEIPYNLLKGSWINPFEQNVIWTFLIGLGMIALNEKATKKNVWVRVATAAGTIALGYLSGLLLMVDYGAGGVMTVLVFYFFRGRHWQDFAGQACALGYLYLELMKGMQYDFTLFGSAFSFPRQGLALLALIPIWLYSGKAGIKHPAFKWVRYAFYPAHMALLGLIAMAM